MYVFTCLCMHINYSANSIEFNDALNIISYINMREYILQWYIHKMEILLNNDSDQYMGDHFKFFRKKFNHGNGDELALVVIGLSSYRNMFQP